VWGARHLAHPIVGGAGDNGAGAGRSAGCRRVVPRCLPPRAPGASAPSTKRWRSSGKAVAPRAGRAPSHGVSRCGGSSGRDPEPLPPLPATIHPPPTRRGAGCGAAGGAALNAVGPP
jgi:hypothetical protein